MPQVAVRVGRYGPYIQAGDDGERVSLEDGVPPDELTLDKAIEYLAIQKEGRIIGMRPEHGLEIYAKAGRFGPYVQRGEPTPDASGRGNLVWISPYDMVVSLTQRYRSPAQSFVLLFLRDR